MSDPVSFTYDQQKKRVICDLHALQKLSEEVSALRVQRILLLTSPSVSKTKAFQQVLVQLKEQIVCIDTGIRAHVPIESIKTALESAKTHHIDAILSIGGGSVIDAAKAVCMILAEGLNDALLAQRLGTDDKIITPLMTQRKIPHIAIPTTLSAAECTGILGITFPLLKEKALFSSPDLAPLLIFYDASLSVETPAALWFSTALRALDHAIERYYSRASNTFNDALCLQTIKLLSIWLPRSLRDPSDLASRLMLQQAAFLSMSGPSTTCLSHAIGHQLGPRYRNVQMDSTAVTQPLVMAFNRCASLEKQKEIAKAMGIQIDHLSSEEASIAAEKHLRMLISAVKNVVTDLPTRLCETGICKEELPAIAAMIWRSPRLKMNPRIIQNKEEIEKLLEQMW